VCYTDDPQLAQSWRDCVGVEINGLWDWGLKVNWQNIAASTAKQKAKQQEHHTSGTTSSRSRRLQPSASFALFGFLVFASFPHDLITFPSAFALGVRRTQFPVSSLISISDTNCNSTILLLHIP
jgi:hypothetical protein